MTEIKLFFAGLPAAFFKKLPGGLLLLLVFLQPIFPQDDPSYHPLGSWKLVTSGFGYRDNPFSGGRDPQFHRGVDIDVEVGDSVYAWRSGAVLFTGYNKTSGNMINLQHAGDLISKYHHLKRIIVKEGDLVEAGQLIALAGKSGRVTGSHLHFSVLKSGEHIDPLPYLKAASELQDPIVPVISGKVAVYKYISLRSYPAPGKVVIDGEAIGTTPLDVKLPYGEHFIEVRADGYEYYVSRLWVDQHFSSIYTASLSVKK